MKKRYIVFTVILTLLLLSLIGFQKSYESTLIKKYEGAVARLTLSEDINYGEVVNRNNIAYGENYSGDYLYEDGTYEYLVEPNGKYVEAIFPQTEMSNTILDSINEKVVSSSVDAENYFRQNFGSIIHGDIHVNTYLRQDGSKTYEVIEKIGNLESGTKASISVDQNNILISAAFIEGDFEMISNIDEEELITPDEAYDNALIQIKNIYNIYFEDGVYESRLKTFRGNVYWELQFTLEIENEAGNNVEKYFEVKVNPKTGIVEEIAEEI